MQSSQFTHLLRHPQAITSTDSESLKAVLQKFPYMQSAWAMILKGLKTAGSPDYNDTLKTTAAYTTDRSILFDFITSETFIQNQISEVIQQNTADMNKTESADKTPLNKPKTQYMDVSLEQQLTASSALLDPSLFAPKQATDAEKQKKPTPEDTLDLRKPLPFNKNETHSFGAWLKLTQITPINRTDTKKSSPEKDVASADKKAKKFELIEKFIAQNPKIKPTEGTASKGNLAKAQMIAPEALMTETLARVYVDQKNYKKALQAYKILSLKYPEKSSFFATQIKAVEHIQEQNRTS